MDEDISVIVKDIEDDPKLLLLAKAITELSEKHLAHEVALKTIQVILAEQQNSIQALNESLQKMGETIDVIIKQMFVVSHSASVPQTFKGVFIK